MGFNFQISDSETLNYITVLPDISGLTFKKHFEKDTYNEVIEPNGDVIFSGIDYEKLNGFSNDLVLYRIFENGELHSEGKFYRRNNTDITNNLFTAKLESINVLSDFAEKSKDKYNILEADDNSYDVIIKNTKYLITKHSEPVNVYSNEIDGTLFYAGTGDASIEPLMPVLNPNSVVPPNSFDILLSAHYHLNYDVQTIGVNKYKFTGIGEFVYARQIAYGYYRNGESIPPNNTNIWGFEELVNYGGINRPLYSRLSFEINSGTNWTNSGRFYGSASGVLVSIKNINNVSDFALNEHFIFKRTRTVKNVYKFLLNKINPLITFDANSFNYFDTFDGEEITFNGTTSNKPYAELSIGQITDFIPNSDGTQKEFSAKVGMLSYDDLNKMMISLGFNYKIVNNIFSLIHFTEFSTTGLNQNLTSINGANYLSRGNQVEYSEPEFDVIKNETLSNSVDFFDGEVKFQKLGINKNITFDSNTFFTDIDDVFRAKGDSYNIEATNQFLLLALMDVGGAYYLRNAIGEVTREKANNSELSFSYLSKNVLSDYPSSIATINGVEQLVNANRVSKLKTVQVSFPLRNLSEIDFTKGVNFFGNLAEYTEISKKANQNIAVAEIKFSEKEILDGRTWKTDLDFRTYDGINIRTYK